MCGRCGDKIQVAWLEGGRSVNAASRSAFPSGPCKYQALLAHACPRLPPSLLFSTNQYHSSSLTHTLPTHLTSILLSDFTSSTPPQTQTNPLTKMSAVTKKTGAAKKAAPAASGPSYRE